MKINTNAFFNKSLLLAFFFFGLFAQAQNHPNLILTQSGVEKIKNQLGKVPLFDATLANVKQEVDAEISAGIDVPIPKDFSGGYTHEQHKKNFLTMQKAGVLYQILNDEKYAKYVKDMLMQYAKIYPTLPLHPQTRSYARGKLFWQCLNDANWLVYTSQAYDCVYNYLTEKERKHLEKNLFRPFADFISLGNPKFFNRIHNHATWGNVAVGMIALVMNDNELLDRALYGIKKDNIDPNEKDDDGGYIRKKGQEVGFLANVSEAFSPDGYNTEGPYYHRYGMYPFLVFAEALQNAKPEIKIFEYNNDVLIKAVTSLLNLTDADGEFFPLNDAQKGMSYYSKALVSSVDIAYYYGGNHSELLSIAKEQDEVLLDETGLAVAIGVRDGLAKPFIKKSINLSDGKNGDEGGVAILRTDNPTDEQTLVMKYTAQGLSHGHYDKLSFSYYDGGNEVLQDYGMGRFVNIQQKGGGNYLPENKTWSKQTIAHNTITQDETSHFNGNFEKGSANHSDLVYFDVSNPKQQVVCTKEDNAYPDTQMKRTMALVNLENFEYPLLVDLMSVNSKTEHQFDLPFYYFGQVISTNFEYQTPKTLEPLGTKFGYQHLWKEGSATINNLDNAQFSWISNQKFKTLTTVTQNNDEIILARIGANDPKFNLRNDPTIILRKKNTKSALYLSTIEIHGSYSPVTENAINAFSNIKNLKVESQDENYTVISITDVKDIKTLLFLTNEKSADNQKHKVSVLNNTYEWTGNIYINQIK